jgi:uncharacterized protein (TIGR02246 family)
MKLAFAVSVAVLLVACDAARGQQPVPASAAKAITQTQDEAKAAIKSAIRSYAEAFERGDGKTLAGLWTPDGDIIDDEGRLLNGRESTGQITAATKDAPRPSFRIEETNLRLLTSDVAIEDGTVEVTPPGATTPLKGWFSATWVRHDGTWKLASVRESQISSSHNAPQLADLDWMVGDWVVMEDHPDREPAAGALPLAPGGSPPIEVSVRWNATRTFLIRDMTLGDASAAAAAGGDRGDGLPAMHITQRIGWDPLSRQIISWSFGSDGSHGEATWTRDDNTWVARTTSVLPDGTQTSSINIYSYDGVNRCTWRSVPTHVGGEHAPHVTMTMVRKPKPASPQPGSPQTSPKGSPTR